MSRDCATIWLQPTPQRVSPSTALRTTHHTLTCHPPRTFGRSATQPWPQPCSRSPSLQPARPGFDKSVPVADGDVFAITVTDKAGGKWFLASFHGDTDGLATIPVTAAVRAQHKLLGDEYTCVAPRLSCSVLHHSLSLGLPPRMFRSPGRSAVFRKQIVVDTHARGGWVGGYGAHAGWCSVWMPTRTRRRQRASSWGTDGLAKHLGFRVWRAATSKQTQG